MKPKLFSLFVLPVILVIQWCNPASAQTSSFLNISSIEALPGDQVRIIFSDSGTGATEYQVESSPAIGTGVDWTTESQAQIVPQAGISHEVTLPADGGAGFFRIIAIGGNGGTEIVARFVSDSIQINESEGSVGIPLMFNQPFQGTLFYTVRGSTTSQDIEPLSGEVQVDGASATITVQLVDNTDLNELRYVTLDLSAGPGYAIGNLNQANVTIQDDDTLWSGNFQENGNPVGFTLKLLDGAGGLTGFLVGDGSGIFPDGEFAAVVNRTDATFSLSISSVVLPAESSMFDTAALLSLTLAANENTEGQTVDAAEIEGEAALTIEFPTQPQLNTSLSGPFLMIKQAVRPSSRQVELSSN